MLKDDEKDDDSKDNGNWIEDATKKQKAKGTSGSFGKATPTKIADAKKEGGVEKKKAVFAASMKKFADQKKAKPGKRVAK